MEDYKEKYEMALEGVQEILSSGQDSIKMSQLALRLHGIFPELKESEDKKIRNRILLSLEKDLMTTKNSGCDTQDLEQCIAWLEKQSKSTTIDIDKMVLKYSQTRETCTNGLPVNCQIRAYRQGINDILEKQGKQEEPQVYETENGEVITYSETDGYKVVEPKFKVGDWVVSRFNSNIHQIINISRNMDYYEFDDGNACSISLANNFYRAWDITDAKDGDVLEFGDHGRLVVGIVSFVNERTGKVDVLCLLDGNEFKIGNFYALDTIKPHPATREQRDQLEKAMFDAGYKWNKEKLKLEKI